MTALVGLLNKRGVALAADSAVTRERNIRFRDTTKYTKNGSKMFRLSNAVPVSVMTCGNASYIANPWDVIIRRYRQQRGNIKHTTVKACMQDFFDFIAQNDIFWNKTYITNQWIQVNINGIFNEIDLYISTELKEKKDGAFVKPEEFLKAFMEKLKKLRDRICKNERCPQFEGYTIELFKNYINPDLYKMESADGNYAILGDGHKYPKDFINIIKDEVLLTLMEKLTRKMEDADYGSTLVFAGFGAEEKYPSLVSADICEGFDHRVNYYVKPENIINISDERPVAFCPFALSDVMKGLIQGQHENWSDSVNNGMLNFYYFEVGSLFEEKEEDVEFTSMLHEVEYYYDMISKYRQCMQNLLSKNQRKWEKTLENSDLKSMASLAESLIDLTGFQRILTFEDESVGGPVDVAIISKNDGFTWLNRKSWYHHKDVNGQYGKFGI